MRHSLPALRVQVAGAPSRVVAVAVLVLLAAGAAAAWLSGAVGRLPVGTWLAGGVAAAMAVLVACTIARQAPCGLAWDRERWLRDGPDQPAQPGSIVVMLDLGAWMLLRFDADPASGPRPRRHWLAVSRHALGADWHPLRCAVYSARPAPGVSSAAVSPAPHE